MVSDIKLNLYDLEELHLNLKNYLDELDKLHNPIKKLYNSLEFQSSDAIDAYKIRCEKFFEEYYERYDIVKDMDKKLVTYTTLMSDLVDAVDFGSMMRVDKDDINHNIKQINTAIEDQEGLVITQVSSDSCHIYPWMSESEAAEKEARYQRNYDKIEGFRTGTVLPAYRNIQDSFLKIQQLYRDYIVPFEELDDKMAGELKEIYNSYTNCLERIWDDRDTINDSFLAFLKPVGIACLLVAATILLPGVGDLLVVALIAGASYYVADIATKKVEEMVLVSTPDNKLSETSKELKYSLLNDRSINEATHFCDALGNGIMDKVQTAEGIAALTGDVVSIVAAPKITKVSCNVAKKLMPTALKAIGTPELEFVVNSRLEKITAEITEQELAAKISREKMAGKGGNVEAETIIKEGSSSSKIDYDLVKDYVRDVESRTGIKLSKNQTEEFSII